MGSEQSHVDFFQMQFNPSAHFRRYKIPEVSAREDNYDGQHVSILRGVQAAGQGDMALHIEENKLQGSDTHAGVQRGGGEGNAQPPAARRGAAGAPPGPQGPRRRPRLQRQHSHRRQPRRHGHNGRFTQRLSYNNVLPLRIYTYSNIIQT